MTLPDSAPKDDPAGVWALQLQLMQIVETILGPRDPSRVLWQPQFCGSEPNVRFSLDGCAVFAELSDNVKSYWPAVLYELAHETVHLLDPGLLGSANFLEEGVAVEFSILAQQIWCLDRIQIPSYGSKYRLALKLARGLPGPLLPNAARIRRDVGRLSAVTTEDLFRCYPFVDPRLADALICKFNAASGT